MVESFTATARGINKDFHALADFRLPVIIRQAGRANGPVLLLFVAANRSRGNDSFVIHACGGLASISWESLAYRTLMPYCYYCYHKVWGNIRVQR